MGKAEHHILASGASETPPGPAAPARLQRQPDGSRRCPLEPLELDAEGPEAALSVRINQREWRWLEAVEMERSGNTGGELSTSDAAAARTGRPQASPP